MKASIPKMYNLFESVPDEDMPQDEELTKFWHALAWELSQMISYAQHAQEPEIVLNPVRIAGTQYIWEFYVNDLAKPRASEYNWHGQNTSQWQYAGCVLLQDGRVSTHH